MTQPDPRPAAKAQDDARVAGRGFLFITFAKVYFIATSAIVSLGLPRLLGDPAAFGDYSVVNSIVSVFNMVMIAATIQAVSKAVSERDDVAGAVRRSALLVQIAVGVPVFLAVFLGADLVAEEFLNHASLGIYLRIASLVILFYSFYAVFVGLFNGQKRFREQATLDVTFSTLKTILTIGLVLLGLGVLGAFAGFVVAALLILGIAAFATRRIGGGRAEDVPFRQILWFMIPTMLYALVSNLLLQVDRWLLKALEYAPLVEHFGTALGRVQLALLTAPLGGGAPTDLSQGALVTAFAEHGTSMLSGFYGAIKNVSFLPYQAIIAITFVVFPLVSRSTFDADRERTRAYITQTFRYALLLMSLLVVVLVATADELPGVLFGAPYAIGARALVLLLVSTIFFSLFYIGNTVITGAGQPRVAALLGLVTFLLNAVLIWTLLGVSGRWQGALEGTALATLVSMFVGFVLTSGYLLWRFRALVPPATVVRVLALGGAIGYGARFVPLHGLVGLVVKAGLVGVLLIVGYVVTKEFGPEDVARVRSVLGRKRAAPPA